MVEPYRRWRVAAFALCLALGVVVVLVSIAYVVAAAFGALSAYF